MAISLTKEEILERFEQRPQEFKAALEKGLRLKLPIFLSAPDDAAKLVAGVLAAYLDVVFTEESDKATEEPPK